ncbi:MAG: ABC transporter permease subunit [Pirellulaceae bacterium]
MFRQLIKKYTIESFLRWGACALVLLLFPWVRIWTISQFELAGFAPLLDQIRSLEKFSPVPLEQFLTYEGVVGLTFDEPILLLCVLVWSIARGSDVVSGELGRGTMEMLLAQPVSRTQVMVAHALVSVLGLACLVLIAWCGLAIGIETNQVPISTQRWFPIPGMPISIPNFWSEAKTVHVPLSQFVSPSLYITPSLNLFSLGLAVWGLSVLMSSWDQYRWRTIGLVLAVYVAQFLLFLLSKSTPAFKPLVHGTFLAAYQPDWMVQVAAQEPQRAGDWWYGWVENSGIYSLGPLGFSAALIGLGVACWGIALLLFSRRDLPAPL